MFTQDKSWHLCIYYELLHNRGASISGYARHKVGPPLVVCRSSGRHCLGSLVPHDLHVLNNAPPFPFDPFALTATTHNPPLPCRHHASRSLMDLFVPPPPAHAAKPVIDGTTAIRRYCCSATALSSSSRHPSIVFAPSSSSSSSSLSLSSPRLVIPILKNLFFGPKIAFLFPVFS
jgi:hypothetical protein